MDAVESSAAAILRTLSAASAGAAGLLRPALAGSAFAPGCAGRSAWHPRLLLLLLLVRRQEIALSSSRRYARQRRAGFSFLLLLGQRELDAPLGWRGKGDADRAALRPGAGP